MMLGEFKFYQIVTVLVALVMIYTGLEKFIRREANQSFLKLGVRLAVWGSMAAVALFPRLTNYVAKFIGIVDNTNAAILIGFLLTYLIIFKILSIIERIERDISALTRKGAMDDWQTETKEDELK